MATTWDTGHCDAAITLSSGNLTASTGAGAAILLTRATSAVAASGAKVYWEILITTDPGTGSNYISTGIASAGFTVPQNAYIGQTTNSAGYSDAGVILNNSGAYAGGLELYQAHGLPATVRWAVDTVNGKLWVQVFGGSTQGWDNSGTDDPATNTGGITIPAGCTGVLYPVLAFLTPPSTVLITAKFASASWAFSAPTNFVSIDAAPSVLQRRNLTSIGTRIGARQAA